MPRERSPTAVRELTGSSGRTRLISVLREQFVAGGNTQVARAVARRVTVEAFSAGRDLIVQGEPEDDLMFILGGSVSVMVNGREVARCTVGDHVGEMCLLDTTALRSATVRAIEPTVVGKLSVEQFTQIALRYPEMWRRMALGLSHDLREWHKVHAAPRAEPAVFIGSSSEGLRIADSIYRSLRRSPVVPRLWTKGVFECSKTTIEDLIRIVNEIDFAIMVLTDDDVTRSRGRSVCSPRDNIIFELGLFMGALSRDRTYIVSRQGVDIKLPTNLLGVKILTFGKDRSIGFCLRPVVKELRRQIAKHGPK